MNKKTKKTFITKRCFVSFVGIANSWKILSIKTVTLKCGAGQMLSVVGHGQGLSRVRAVPVAGFVRQ